MLTVEEAFDISLIEEGQFLLGEDFITETLGFGWDKINKVFVKALKEYAKRKPVVETKVFRDTSGQGQYTMPEGTLSVTSIRYDILEYYPRFMFPDFGQIQYEFEKHNRLLKTFPPMQSLRITYSREYTLSDSAPILMSEYTVDYETDINLKLIAHPKKGTINVSKNGKSMVETGVTRQEVDNGTNDHPTIKVIALKGDLGKGFYNPQSRELSLFIKKGEDGDVNVTFTPKYKSVVELSSGDYVFMELFKSYLLEGIASLRNQATQAHLHNIDLSTDDLYGRARLLRAEAKKHMRETIDFSAMAPI